MGKLKNHFHDEICARSEDEGEPHMKLPEESSFTPAPAGAHVGVCIGFVDMGTQPSFYEDGKPAHKVRITWELDEHMDDGRPFTISKTYTWSMNDRATLRSHLESWRGVPFKKEDFGPNGFDTKNLLLKPCMVTVQHKDVNGALRASVAGVAKLMKGVQPFTPLNVPTYLSLDPAEFDEAVLNELGDKTQEAIRATPEYAAIKSTKNGSDKYSDRGAMTADLDDEIPF